MTWITKQRHHPTPQDVFDLSDTHRLVWEDRSAFIDVCKSVSIGCQWYDIMDGDDYAGTILLSSVIDGVSATIELIPVPVKFSGYCMDDVRSVIMPLVAGLFTEHRVNRIDSSVPHGRHKTKKALMACGFVREGTRRMGVHLRRRDPEDLLLLGMTVEDYKKVSNG